MEEARRDRLTKKRYQVMCLNIDNNNIFLRCKSINNNPELKSQRFYD